MLRPICLYILCVLLLITGSDGFSQQLKLGKNPSAVIKSAVLELESSNQGLLFPRLTDTAGINLFSPPDGMVIYLTTAKQLFVRSNGRWSVLTSGTIDTTSIANFYLKVRNDLNAGTGISYNKATGVITNSAPDQTVGLTAGSGIGITGTYPNFTITNNSLSSGGTVTSVTSANGAATITNPTTTPVITIVSAPKLTNARTIQGVSFDGSANINLFNGTGLLRANGTNITYDNNSYLTSIDTGNIANFSNKVRTRLTAGTGITYNNTTGVITNSAPDQTVALAAGTGIGVSGTYPNFTITNNAPNQTVGLTAGTGIGITGTYPNFTITNTAPAIVGGTVTSVTSANGAATITNPTTTPVITIVSAPKLTNARTIQGVSFDGSANINLFNGTGLLRANGTNITYDNNSYLTSVDTGNISNFYVKTRSLFSGTAPVTYNNTTGMIGIAQASGSTDGYLSAADWTTFNNKLSSNNVWTRQGNAGTNPGTDFIGTTDAKDLIFKTQGIERWRIENSSGDIKIGDATSGTFKATKELVMRQDGDTYGSSILRLRNRNAENGAIFETTDPTTTLVDFIFKTAISQRNIRYEGRSTYNRVGIPAFHIGGADPDNPNLAIGDVYSAFNTKLKIGNYTTATEMLDVAGNVKFSGALMPNGDAGTSGYYLRSNGANAAPTWVAISGSGSGWSLTGNSGTSSSNYIGTSDGQPLIFKINGTQAGYLGLSGSSFATSFGVSSSAGYQSTAIGASANASTSNLATALGYNTNARGYQSVAIGANAQTANSNDAIAIGYNSNANSYQGIAIGSGAGTSSNNSALAIGVGSSASGQSSTAIGAAASASGQNATAIGTGATASQANSVIIGNSGNSNLKVGIGTNTPSQLLDVNGNVEFSGALMPNNLAGTSGQFLQSNGANTAPTWVSATNVVSDDYVYSYSTSTKTFSSAGNWTDLTFNTAHPQLSGWTHSTSSNTQNFTCTQTGVYQVVYSGQVNNTSSSNTYELAIRALLDGSEIPGSVSSVECSNSNPTIANNFLVSISAGQVLKLQLTGSSTNIRLSPGSYGTTKPSISITIIRIK